MKARGALVITVVILIVLIVLQVVLVVDSLQPSDANENSNAVKKSPRHNKWSNIDEGKLDKELEKGDDKEELAHEWESVENVNSKKPQIAGGSGGSAMIFIDLFQKDPQNKAWNKSKEAKLASKWKTMTRSGGLDVDVFNLGDLKLMFNLHKKWLLQDAFKFIATQPEVKSFRFDNRDYDPADYLEQLEDDEDDL